MKQLKKLLLLSAFAASSFSIVIADDMNNALQSKLDTTVDDLQSLSTELNDLLKETDKQLRSKKLAYSGAFGSRKNAHRKTQAAAPAKKEGDKNLFIRRGDFKLGIGGKTKIEHYYQKNISLQNSKLPDQAEYFKNYFDLILDLSYGEKTFGHKAVQAYTDIRHKGVWGRGSVFADSDASSPTSVQLANTSFGSHSHTNGKPLLWIKDAWLQLSINAMLGQKDAQNIHHIQLGWFPFELGRGIALGSSYGLNRESLGLYSYPEDKSAPGIRIGGDIIKDTLSYDFYYSKFEERNKSIKDTFNTAKAHLVGKQTTPWRGLGKDDEVFAARLKWACSCNKLGKFDIEPYVMYNEASDQQVTRLADTKMQLGTYGLNLEHSWKGFSWGGEVAVNFGNETVKATDLNQTEIVNDAGTLVERYTHVLDAADNKVLVTDASKEAAQVIGDHNNNGNLIQGAYHNAADRYTKEFKNSLRGWMAVVDAAYKFKSMDLTLAAAYGYASGGDNPHKTDDNKNYHGFIGLHEIYSGKRVKSVIILDERLLQTPSSLHARDEESKKDFAFTDLQHAGFSADWKPSFGKTKKLCFNPNIMFFWKADSSKEFDVSAGAATKRDASKFMGTEINLIAKLELLKGLKLYGNFAAFLPGQYFTDVKGVPMDKDLFNKLALNTADKNKLNAADYRLSDDTAYHVNVGFEYKF